jgi:hypothetical protein
VICNDSSVTLEMSGPNITTIRPDAPWMPTGWLDGPGGEIMGFRWLFASLRVYESPGMGIQSGFCHGIVDPVVCAVVRTTL